MSLTPKQQAFCDYYIETGNATEAYKRAGYQAQDHVAEVNASRLLSNAKVREYIDERMKQKKNARIISQDRVLEFLSQVVEGEIEEEVVTFAADGTVQRTTKKPSVRDRSKAAELLGKRYLLWTDKQVVDSSQKVTIVEDMGVNGLDDVIEKGEDDESQPS
ncbi:terminase small subunit (plasmid) [Alicyclobacillus curvatus]|nr:terminase small subunit [Alicyclobacillus curvatus]